MIILEDQREIQLMVHCRDGPIKQRKCTDCFCCTLYLLLITTLLALALLANQAPHLHQTDIEKLLKVKGQDMPYLSTQQVIPDILIGLAVATALCMLIVVTTYILPQIAAYVYIPLCLLLMLVLGVGFLYRYFGNRLPFLDPSIQKSYIDKYSPLTLLSGITFIVGFAISLLVILAKQQRIKFIVAALKLAKLCFWDNCYVFGVSIVLTGITMAFYYTNIQFVRFFIAQKSGQEVIPRYPMIYLTLFEVLWTHGFLKSYSDFLFQSIALHWYYNSHKHQSESYSGLTSNLLPSLSLSIKHIGTIVFASILAYFPEFINPLLNNCEQKSLGCYNFFCCCHKLLCDSLNKYSHLGTIMYGYPFCRASGSIRRMRGTAKHTFPQLYMVGNFYVTLMKIFVILLSLLICYLFIIFSNNFSGNLNLIGPILVTLLASDEIANHFMNTTGLVGDSIYFTYVMDLNCQTTNFGNLNAGHCPKEAYDIINQAKIGRYSLLE